MTCHAAGAGAAFGWPDRVVMVGQRLGRGGSIAGHGGVASGYAGLVAGAPTRGYVRGGGGGTPFRDRREIPNTASKEKYVTDLLLIHCYVPQRQIQILLFI